MPFHDLSLFFLPFGDGLRPIQVRSLSFSLLMVRRLKKLGAEKLSAFFFPSPSRYQEKSAPGRPFRVFFLFSFASSEWGMSSSRTNVGFFSPFPFPVWSVPDRRARFEGSHHGPLENGKSAGKTFDALPPLSAAPCLH